MKRWSLQQTLALIFGLLLAVGTVMPTVQASEMALDLTMSGCMDSVVASCCDDCGGDAEDAYAGDCLPICAGGGACAIIPLQRTLKTAGQPQMLAQFHPESRGRASFLDPHPPRTIDLV